MYALDSLSYAIRRKATRKESWPCRLSKDKIRYCFSLCCLPPTPFSPVNRSIQNAYDQSKANRRLLATATQVFSSPHSYGCAGQCFGSVRSGSIFESTKGRGPQIAGLFQGSLFPLTFSRSWRASPWLALVQKSCLPYSAPLALFFVNVPSQVILAHINPGTYFPGFI